MLSGSLESWLCWFPSNASPRNRTPSCSFEHCRARPAHSLGIYQSVARPGVEPGLAASEAAVRSHTLTGCCWCRWSTISLMKNDSLSPKARIRLPHLHRATWLVTLFVAWGAWNALTDSFPLNEQQARPSWYLYGWPICFATSGRGRFNFGGDFYFPSLLIDLLLMLAMLASTVVASEAIIRGLPKLSLRNLLAMVLGVAFGCALWQGTFDRLWELMLGARAPEPNISEVAGELRPAFRIPYRLSPFVTWPMTVGFFCLGFSIGAVSLRFIHSALRSRTSA